MVNKVCRCDLTALTKFVAEIMAIQAGLTAVRFYYNVCTSPANQLELVMEGVQVKLSPKLYVLLPIHDFVPGVPQRQPGAGEERPGSMQLQGGHGPP